MPQQDDFEKFLEEEGRGSKKPAPSVSTTAKDDFLTFLEEGEVSPDDEPKAKPLPRPKRQESQAPAYIPLTQRQEFGKRLPDISTTVAEGWRRDQGRMAREKTELAEKSKGLRVDKRKPLDLSGADRRLGDLVSDPVRMRLLTPDERQFLAAAAEDERRRIPIEPRQKPAAPAAFKEKRELKPGTKVKLGSLRPGASFDAAQADRAMLDIAADPSRTSDFTAQEFEALQTVRERVKGEIQQENLDRLAAEREAEAAAAPGYGSQLVNRFARGAAGTGASTLRGITLLDPDLESRANLEFLAPDNVQNFTRDVLPVDPTDESLLSKGVEAAGSSVPFVAASALGGMAGAPAWLAASALGAASNAGQTYDEALQAGQQPEAAKRAAIVGALIGLTEGLGVGRIGGGAVSRGALSEFTEEGLQEALSQALNNVNAKILSGYDPRRAIEDGVAESFLLGGIVGGVFGGGVELAGRGAEAADRLATRRAEIEAVRNEPAAPLDLQPTTTGPTNLISLREAAKPEFRKRLDEATGTAPAAPAASPEAVATAAAPAAQPSTINLNGMGQAIAENLQTALRESVAQTGALPRAERGSLLDQVYEAAVTRGFPRDAATLDQALQLAGLGLDAAKAQFGQVFPAGGPAAQAAAAPATPADPLERLKSLRKPTEADAKQAQKEAEKQSKQAGKEFEAQAKRVEKEIEKETKADEKATAEAEGELRRMRLYDESVNAARDALDEAEAMIEAGDYSGAIGKLRAQQNALGQSVKYLPETPEAVQTKANVAEIVEGISERVKDLRKQALDAQKPTQAPAATGPTATERAAAEKRHRAETGERLAERYKTEGRQKYDAGDLAGAEASYRASLQALNDAMRLTPPADVGRRTQLRNAITAVENDLRGVSGELKKGRAQRPARVTAEDAETAPLASTPLLEQVNNPEGLPPVGEGPAPTGFPISFDRLAEREAREREEAAQSERRKRTETLSPIEYLKRKTGREGIRVSDRGEARVLGSREAGIVGLTNRNSRWSLADAQVMLEEGGFSLDDGRRFTDPSVTENDVLDFLGAYGKQDRLDTAGLDQRLAEEEAEHYARLEEEYREREAAGEAETEEGIFEQGPASERLTAPSQSQERLAPEETPAETARNIPENIPPRVPAATAENIDTLRARYADLDRLRYDRQGELTRDLSDELRELGSVIYRYDAERAKAERGGRFDPDAPPDYAPRERTATPEEKAAQRAALDRAMAAAEVRLEDETRRAAEILPADDTRALELGISAIDAMGEDEDARELLDLAIEGDTDAERLFVAWADRGYGIDADTARSLIDTRREFRERDRAANRRILAERKALEARNEADNAQPSEAGQPVEADEAEPRGPSQEVLDLLNQNPAEIEDADFDQHLRSLEALNNDRIHGVAELPEWATRQLEERIRQANEIRRSRVKEKRLGPKNPKPEAKGKPLSKKEAGRRIAEQAKKKEAEKEAEETPTVVHPNPAIDRQPIIAETADGRVIVPNPENKGGISVVKDRSDEPAEHKFSSTQVNLPSEIADQIIAFGKRIPDSDLAEDGREMQPHVTLKYGLHGADSKFVEDALAGEEPIKVTFGQVSLFENDDVDVVKVDIDSSDLHRLNKLVAESQPVTDTFPDYKPYATVAYVRKGKGAKYVGDTFLQGQTATLNTVTFSGRDGERVEIPLTGKPQDASAASEADRNARVREKKKTKLSPGEDLYNYFIAAAIPEGGGHYMGAGLGALQPLLERAGSQIARRTKVPVPESFDPAKYAEEIVEEAEKRKITNDQTDALNSEFENLVKAIEANDGWAVVDASRRINKVIGSRRKSEEIAKIDPGIFAKLSALRKAGFLARIPTHLRNIFGNGIFQAVREVDRMPAAMADTLISLGTGRRTVAGPSATAVGRAIKKAATQGVKEAGQVLKKGLTDEEAQQQQLQETRFRNPILDAYTRYVFRSLSASDKIFFRGAYDRTLSERARLQSLNEAREGTIKRADIKKREKEIRENPDLDMDLAAKEDARIAVFHNDNKFSDITSAIRSRVGSGGNFAIDTVLPFDRTPSNIFIRTLEYTPLGYGRNVIQAGRAMISREFTPEQQRAFAQTFGQATTGTFGVMLLGYLLASRGLLTGFYDEEDKQREALRRAAGQMPASVRIGDRWYSVGGLAPLGTLLALGATVHRETHEEVKDEEDRPLRSLKASSKFVFDLPLMKGTKDVVDAASQPGSLGQRLGRIGASFIPAPVADIGTLGDSYQRDTASSLKGLRKMREEFTNEMRARLPITRSSLPPKVDVFGDPVETEKSDPLDPFSSRPAKESVKGLRELLDLNLGLSKPKRETGETGEEYNRRVRERGKDYKSTLGDLSDDADVGRMSREAQRAVYEKSLDAQAMERAGKLSSGSVRIERQIEGLRIEAYAALRSIPEYSKLSASDQKAVRKLVDDELRRFRAKTPTTRKTKYGEKEIGEKEAQVPDWTPEDLARAAMEARE